MKVFKSTIIAGFLFLFFTGSAQHSFFGDSDLFFKKYVFDGRINYSLIKENQAALNSLVEQIENFPMTDEIGNTNKAFYINAYNILVISQIIDTYPVNSPEEIPGFFESIKHNVAGDLHTLNQIESDKLRSLYNDPRIHFVLVCGGLGCPPITNFAYVADRLDSQLENQTKKALDNPDFIRYQDGRIGLSEIFKWYTADFLNESADLITYINRYRDEPINLDSEIYYYPYDWSINDFSQVNTMDENQDGLPQEASAIYTYTPSSLLKKGQIEAQLFNNLYTQTAYRNEDRELIELDERGTYYGGLIYALYGVSKNARINVGFDLNVKAVYIDETKGSPLEVFRFDKTPNSRTAVASIGPKIKFQPFRKFSHFSVQSAFWIPVSEDLEAIKEDADYPWLDYHMYTWWNQFFYDYSPSNKWQIFTEADLLFRFKTNNSNTPSHLDIPVSLFVSYFPINKMSLYGQIQYAPRFQLKKTSVATSDGQPPLVTDPFTLVSDYAHTGLGLKYQLTPKLNLEVSSTYFFQSKNNGAGYTFNLGFRIII